MEEAVSYFERAITAARITLGGRTSVEGPHGVPSSKTVYGITMIVEALKRIELKVK